MVLGGSWAVLGGILGGIGWSWAFLGGSGAVLGGPGVVLAGVGGSWDGLARVLGESWDGLGGSLGGLGSVLGSDLDRLGGLWVSWGRHGTSCGRPWGVLGRLGSKKVANMAPTWSPKRSQNQEKIEAKIDPNFGGSWGRIFKGFRWTWEGKMEPSWH